MPELKKHTILVISNENAARAALLRYLTISGFHTYVAETVEDAMRYLEAEPALVLLDMVISGKDGLLVLRDIHEKNDQVRILLLTDQADIAKAQAALNEGARDFVTKPIDLPALKRTLQVHLPH